ncbi:alpha/beta hydrolase [Maricaulis sp.]|uniref:alpha/beta fold hydrolase n=1 Tax=Maricaulis sp. TaxID=1486257 RepID=UPI0025C42117|nr:alpha/beta hydrolase [Maricaulis sp.]
MSDAAYKQDRLASPSGADLAIYTHEAEGTPRGIVHINHGLAEHAGRYARMAARLAARGYHVIAHDHRGHGKTEAADGGPRRFADKDGWNKLMQDVAAVHAEARRRWPGLPLVIFGHSMGSVIAFNHILRAPDSVTAAAIWNGNMALGGLKGVMRLILAIEALFGGGALATSHMLDNLTFKAWNKRFPERRSDADWLSRDTDEVDAYVNDPLSGWPSTVSLWRDFLDGVAYAEDDNNLAALPKALPMHLIAGSKDPATEGGKSMQALARRLRKAGLTEVRLEVLKDFRHETMNEIGRDAQIEAFADWLDQVTG